MEAGPSTIDAAMRLPADQTARRRLRDAQRREAAALLAVARAERRIVAAAVRAAGLRAEAARLIAQAQCAHDAAVADLVSCSGVERAAVLLNQSARTVRRCRRAAAAARHGGAEASIESASSADA